LDIAGCSATFQPDSAVVSIQGQQLFKQAVNTMTGRVLLVLAFSASLHTLVSAFSPNALGLLAGTGPKSSGRAKQDAALPSSLMRPRTPSNQLGGSPSPLSLPESSESRRMAEKLNPQEFKEHVQGLLLRRQVRAYGIKAAAGFFLAAAVLAALSTGKEELIAALLAAVVAVERWHSFSTINGYMKDSIMANPLPESMFDIRPAEGKGMGLFAKERIPAGAFLMEYSGERIDAEEYYRRYYAEDGSWDQAAGYVVEVNENEFIDGANSDCSVSRFINHSSDPNVELVIAHRPGGFAHLYTNRQIEVGQELSFSYGEEYWAAMGINPE